MKTYELMMIIDPKLEKAVLETLVADIRAELDAHGAEIQAEDVWGARDMAYQINGSNQGYYLIYTLSVTEPNTLQGLENALGLKKGLWRHLLTAIPAKK